MSARKISPATIEAATVRFPRLGGLGVLVPGQMIATAAHVVSWTGAEDMVLGDYVVETVQAGARVLEVRPLTVEPVADIALLGALDGQEFADAEDAFEAFCATTRPVSLCTANFPLFEPIPVRILTHLGQWVDAHATQCAVNAPNLHLDASEGIISGTSGGPVVPDGGRLLGVISNAGGPDGAPSVGSIPRLSLAAPAWLVRRMINPQWETRQTRKFGLEWEKRQQQVARRGGA